MVKCQLKFNNLNYSYNIFYSRNTIGLKTLIKLYSGIRIIYECLFESFSKWVFWKSHQDAMRRNTLKTTDYNTKEVHLTYLVLGNRSFVLILWHYFWLLTIWLSRFFYGSQPTLFISVLITIWVLSTTGTCQEDVIYVCWGLYSSGKPPRDWGIHFFSQIMGTEVVLGL